MKNIIFILVLLPALLKAQVGINTTSPAASLDVTGNPTSPASLDCMIYPRVAGNTLKTFTFTAPQTGSLVYVTAAAAPTNTQTARVLAPGYFYFDGTAWQDLKTNHTGGTVRNFGNIGGATSVTLTVDGVLVSSGSYQQGARATDITVVHNLNLNTSSNGNFFISATFLSMSTGNNYTQLNLDNSSTKYYAPIIHDQTANSFQLFLEDDPDLVVEQLSLMIDIITSE